MTTFRFKCLGAETFKGSRWVTVHLYGNHKLFLPVSAPLTPAGVEVLHDLEVFGLWATTDLVCRWRSQNISGWPKWALEISAGRGKLTPQVLFGLLAERIQKQHGIDVSDVVAIPFVTGVVMINHVRHELEAFITDDCELAREPWQS